MMENSNETLQDSQAMMDRLVEGFEVLQQEYQRIWFKSQVLERNLKMARMKVRATSLLNPLP